MSRVPAETGRLKPPATDEVAELLRAVTEATSRVEASNTRLQEQVARLTNDLNDANVQLERQRRLAALGEMAAGIAHEVRNPLGCVLLYASMLERDLAERPAESAMATKITRAAKAVEAIVTDVLSFARELRLRHEDVTVESVFDRALENCSHDAVAGGAWKQIRIERAYTDAADTAFEADPGLLTQALTNLIRNAIEAMAEAPGREHTLRLEASERRVADGTGRRPRCVVLTVRDTGPGVTPDVVARMFNPFFTTRGTGTGLGLAIVHRIVDAHGGRVSVTNNAKGPGAAAEIVIPCSAADAIRPGPSVQGADGPDSLREKAA
ncbi:MAG: hypothetical protein JSR77_08770 [Planctomycetes bacterium]|nr:hypothetical protein [Planctomycetota bacterium]